MDIQFENFLLGKYERIHKGDRNEMLTIVRNSTRRELEIRLKEARGDYIYLVGLHCKSYLMSNFLLKMESYIFQLHKRSNQINQQFKKLFSNVDVHARVKYQNYIDDALEKDFKDVYQFIEQQILDDRNEEINWLEQNYAMIERKLGGTSKKNKNNINYIIIKKK